MSDALGAAIDLAIARRDPRALHDLLARGSGLPGPRANQALVESFAEAARARGAAADAMLDALESIDADAAPGGTPLEFLPMCGVAGIGARAAHDDAAFAKALDRLHARADDLRFRVRDEVAAALAKIGARRGDALVPLLAPWMDGYFHAAAVVRALGTAGWLTRLGAADEVTARMDEAFALLRDAPRSAARWPGFKALLEAMQSTPRALAERFGVPVFDQLERWAESKDPALRELVAKNLGGTRLAGRFAAEVHRVQRALERTAPARRDPRTDVGPTRGRGKKRR